MSQLNKTQLEQENQTSFPNNNAGFITPIILREFNTDMIDSTVNQTIYTSNSASFSSSIANLQNFSSSLQATFVTEAELTATRSLIEAELNASSSTLQTNINVTSASLTGQLNTSASVLQTNINGKANASLSASLGLYTASINTYTQSN